MYTERAISILIPLLVLSFLWVLMWYWILPFVLGFVLAVALGPSARPMLASAWSAVVQVGDRIFGTGSNAGEPRPDEWNRGSPRRGRYEEYQ